jgi:sterol desaturase/sphingolipid hydroxylase (fatty acid hydroxylase superfamily)
MGVIGLLAWSLGYTPRTGLLPIWLQAILSLLIADIIGYWSHRLRHTPGFWKFHVIHHAPVRLDWLAAARMHPVDDIVDNTLVGVPILLLGFDLRLFAFLGPVLLLHTLLVHANVRWNFGPLRWVFVSPALHRWHHARDLENRPRNFAGMFAFVDWIFGTFYLPAEQPVVFGTLDENLPDGLSGQLVYPFSMLTLPTKERP